MLFTNIPACTSSPTAGKLRKDGALPQTAESYSPKTTTHTAPGVDNFFQLRRRLQPAKTAHGRTFPRRVDAHKPWYPQT